VIRRIFKVFADGQTPKHIAAALNAEDIYGPVAMTPAAGQSGLRFTLRARRVWEG